jgi:hypothetical protein
MKAITVKQPWAWLITAGHKDIENRNWTTPYRGPILIHAGKEVDKDYWKIANHVRDEFGIEIPEWTELPLGSIVGIAEITDVVESSESPWWQSDSRYGFVLANARPLPPRSAIGQLGIYDAAFEMIEGELKYVPRKRISR